MKVRSMTFIVIIAIVTLFISSCNSPLPPEVPPEGATAEELTNQGIALMKAQDWDGALTKFSEAVLKDPSYGRAVVGYSALNIASIMSDSNVVNLARNKLGMDLYPTTMNAVLEPSNWMVTLQAPYSGMMPHISGEEAYDEILATAEFPPTPTPGVIDPNERIFAMVAWFMTHNNGFDNIVGTVGTALGTRLDTAIAAIKAVSDTAKFSLTWDMFMDTAPTSGWPMKDGAPMEIFMGKAEILAIASGLEVVKGLTSLVQMYSLSLPLADYWDSYNPAGGNNEDPANKPFETFLQLNADAAARLASAKASYLAAGADLNTALTAALTDRPGFFLSTDPVTGGFTDPEDWDSFTRGVRVARKIEEEIVDSIQNNDLAFFPITTPDPDAWPTEIINRESIGINFGIFFNTPLGLFTTVIELSAEDDPAGEAAGEPVYYDLNGDSFEVVTDVYFPVDNDFTDIGEALYLRIPDITLGGIVPVDDLPLDDSATRYYFSMSYDDADLSGKWDPGEWINSKSFYSRIEGIIVPTDPNYGGDPAGYYELPDDVPDTLLEPYTDAANYAALNDALDSITYISIYNLVYLDGNSLYLQFVPNYEAWNSFAAKGTTGVHPDGVAVLTSAGSIYWRLGQMLEAMF
jgi:hypothetical protein